MKETLCQKRAEADRKTDCIQYIVMGGRGGKWMIFSFLHCADEHEVVCACERVYN